jgi:hypothetical protein
MIFLSEVKRVGARFVRLTIESKPLKKRLRVITSGQYSFFGISKTAGRGGCLNKRREYWLISGEIASLDGRQVMPD